MAKSGTNPKQVWKKMSKLSGMVEKVVNIVDDNRGCHRQSKLKHLRKNLQKFDQRDYVEVDLLGCPTGVHRSEWLILS